jgi:arylsulfatase A
MRWPLQIKSGQVSREPVSSLDLMPTFANLAAGEIPIEIKLDGTDIVNAFGKDEVIRKRPMFWCYYSALNRSKIALREGDWKLLASLKSNDGKYLKIKSVNDKNISLLREIKLVDFELYNIAEDRSESINLAQKNTKQLEKLSKLMRSIFNEVLEDSTVW